MHTAVYRLIIGREASWTFADENQAAAAMERSLNMSWPVDHLKLDRVRALMKDQDVSALVVRAPITCLYLTNYWCNEGNDAGHLPCEGEPILIPGPQLPCATQSWTKDIQLFKELYERDPGRLNFVRSTLRLRSLSSAAWRQSCRRTQYGDAIGRSHGGRAYDPTQFILMPSAKSQVRSAIALLSSTKLAP